MLIRGARRVGDGGAVRAQASRTCGAGSQRLDAALMRNTVHKRSGVSSPCIITGDRRLGPSLRACAEEEEPWVRRYVFVLAKTAPWCGSKERSMPALRI